MVNTWFLTQFHISLFDTSCHFVDHNTDSTGGADMENVPGKPSAARVFFWLRVKFWPEHTLFFVTNGVNGVNLIRLTFPSLGKVLQAG